MSTTLPQPTPIAAAAAIRVGRAVEAWGREYAYRRNEHRMNLVRLRAEARMALDEHDRLIWMTTFAPLI